MNAPIAGAASARIAEALEENRRRTLAIADGFTDDDLVKVHEPTMGPAHWDLGHIAHFEELWLVHGPNGEEARCAFLDDTWDAEKQPRPTREKLDIPARQGALAALSAGRAKTLTTLDRLDIGPQAADPLLRDGFVHRMILMHEAQHQENILITASMVPEGRFVPTFRTQTPTPRIRPRGMVPITGAAFPLGHARAPGAYDNESPQHEVTVAPFEMDIAPVTNADYIAFIDAGGYEDETFWDEDGWLLMRALKFRHPKHWALDANGGWSRRAFDRREPIVMDEPVVHVSWYEADAYARWAGKRLPTESEWEMAATWDATTNTKHAWPWGETPWTPQRANLDQALWHPARVGSYPDGVSPSGCHQMMGDVWEWTSSIFTAYPGFEAYPYDEYSKPFFDRGFRVLRGGAFATRALAVSPTFRNWHQPDHQQIFAGFRCARGGNTQ